MGVGERDRTRVSGREKIRKSVRHRERERASGGIKGHRERGRVGAKEIEWKKE